MKATSKVKALKYAIVLVLVIWMASPVISLFTEGDEGLSFSIGSESVFEVGDTTEDAIESNLENSRDEGAQRVLFANRTRDLGSGDLDALASEIKGSGASTYTAVDGDGLTVTVESVDASTAEARIQSVRVNATDRFLDSISPGMSIGFALGQSEVSVPTDSRIERGEGCMDIVVEIPRGLDEVAVDLGCELVICVDVHYMGLLDASVGVGMDDKEYRDAEITVSGSVCTVALDPDADASRLDGGRICGATASVSPSDGTVTFDIGASDSLSSFLESALEKDGSIDISYSGGSVSFDGEAARGIVEIVRILEGSA